MKKHSRESKIKFGLFVLFFLIVGILIYVNFDKLTNIDIDKCRVFIEEQGHFAGLVYLGFFIIKPLLFIIPTNIIAILAGAIFGTVEGFLLTMGGFFIAGTIAFYISRLLGREFIEKLLGDRFIRLDNKMEEHGFKVLFMLRLPPILPYDPLSYACGITKIRYKDFILASLLGVVPETICYSIMGANADNPLSVEFILPIVLVVLATLFSKKIMNLRKKGTNKD